jgi:hypothetical protein
MIVALAGMFTSSLVIWWNAFSSGGTYGGEAVSLSSFGHLFFLALGAGLGLCVAAIFGSIFLAARFDPSSEINNRNFLVLLFLSLFLSPLIATGVVAILSMTIFFAIPDFWFRILFDVSMQ